MIHDVLDLKAEVRDYFLKRYSQDPSPGFDFYMVGHPQINAEQNAFLEAIPPREEIKNAVWACGTEKAPGFDGYNFKFIRKMWVTR